MSEPFSPAQMDLLVSLASAAARKAIAEASFVHLQPGEVVAVRRKNDGSQVADVHMDGDEVGNTIAASIVGVSEPVAQGDRVMLVYSPPHAHHVFGVTRPKNGAATPACWQSGSGEPITASATAGYHIHLRVGLAS